MCTYSLYMKHTWVYLFFSSTRFLPLFLFFGKSKHVSNRLQISTTKNVGNKRKPLFSQKNSMTGQAKEPANQKISAAECLQQEQQMEANNIRKKHKCDVFIFKKESKKKLKKMKGIVRYFFLVIVITVLSVV